MSLRWTEPADDDLVGYHLYRDGQLVATAAAPLTFYTFGGLLEQRLLALLRPPC